MAGSKQPHRRDDAYANHIIWERVGARILSVREGAGMTRPELSAATGIPAPTLRGIEDGASMPLVPVLRIAKALGVSINELVPEGVV